MIIEAIKSLSHIVNDTVYVTRYKTLVDPNTHKKYIEVSGIEYQLYNNRGEIHVHSNIGTKFDTTV